MAKKGSFGVAWIGYLLVLIGCMAGWMTWNTAGLIMRFNTFSGLLAYGVYVSALVGVIFGILMLLRVTKISALLNLIILIICVGAGVVLILTTRYVGLSFSSINSILVLVGWIVAVIGTFFVRGR